MIELLCKGAGSLPSLGNGIQAWYYPGIEDTFPWEAWMAEASRSELGDFLRSRRERLDAGDLGLPTRRRRRTPGLRREEVAELAGIGVDWYIRLEQGRSVSPSVTTIDALARALRLDRAEHAHLRSLARTGGERAFVRERVPEAIQRLVAGLNQPAYVTGRCWDILAWNAAAADVFADFGRIAEPERNILLYVLTDPDARRLFGETWAEEARRMVAQFRPTFDLWAGDPAFVDLVGKLRARCPEFAAWWDGHDVRGAAAGRKHLTHPTRGPLDFTYATFQANEDPNLKLAIYSPL